MSETRSSYTSANIFSSVSLDIARAKTDSSPMDTGDNGEMQFYEASATDLDGLTDANGAPLLKKLIG